MDKRLKIITLAFMIVYTIIIGGHIKQHVSYFVDGFKKGYQAAQSEEKASLSNTGVFFISLKSEEGLLTFPTEMINQADNSPMKTEIGCMVVELSEVRNEMSGKMIVADVFSFLLGLFTVFVMIFLPVQAFRVVRSITKDKIFDCANIRKLRSIGYALLAYYVAGFFLNFFQYRIAAHVVQVDGYMLRLDLGNFVLIILGLVVLMFAEVLKITAQLKEEQELTI